MEIKAMEAAVEALLFAMGEAIPAADIAQVLEIDTEEARKLIRNMMTHYDEEDRGVQIIELEDSFQMYHQGIDMLKACNDKMDKIEKQMLVLDSEGETHEFES